jgi:hypothetical protein
VAQPVDGGDQRVIPDVDHHGQIPRDLGPGGGTGGDGPLESRARPHVDPATCASCPWFPALREPRRRTRPSAGGRRAARCPCRCPTNSRRAGPRRCPGCRDRRRGRSPRCRGGRRTAAGAAPSGPCRRR